MTSGCGGPAVTHNLLGASVKIAVAGLGYVGMANAVLLAQHNHVIALDIDADRVRPVSYTHLTLPTIYPV